RKVLVDKLNGPAVMGDELSSAAKSEQRETMSMVSAIDDAMDRASGGQWRNYLQEVKQRSKPITSGAAMGEVTRQLAGKPSKGSTPEVTYTGLNRAVERFGGNDYGDAFLPQLRSDVGSLVEHLRQAEAPARTRKVAGTMGGGSQTSIDTQLANWMGGLIEKVT